MLRGFLSRVVLRRTHIAYPLTCHRENERLVIAAAISYPSNAIFDSAHQILNRKSLNPTSNFELMSKPAMLSE
jgi:hypothetical protein